MGDVEEMPDWVADDVAVFTAQGHDLKANSGLLAADGQKDVRPAGKFFDRRYGKIVSVRSARGYRAFHGRNSSIRCNHPTLTTLVD